MSPPLITACFIVRDEARFLPDALASVAGVVDEIVVVDTGSVDQTVAIAQAYNARVVHHVWGDDFAAARNAAHLHAHGSWLLWLDADERLISGEGLREALTAEAPSVGGYVIERHDVVVHPESGRTDVFPVGMVRLFRRDPRLRWVGIVHERPGDTIIDAGLTLRIATQFRLSHLVSALPQSRLREKQQRYLRLLDRAIAADPSDAWSAYYRGKTRWYLGAKAGALDDFARVTAATGVRCFLRASAWAMRGALLLEDDDTDGAIAALDESLRLAPDQPLARALLGEVRYARGEFEAAIAAWSAVRLSLAPGTPGDAVPGDLYMLPEKRAYKIGCGHLALGHLVEAMRCFEEGLSAAPNDAACFYGLARIALLRQDRSGARVLLTACRNADPGWREPRFLGEQIRCDEAPREWE